MARSIAILLASGSGARTGFAAPKQLAMLGGRPLIAHSIERFEAHPAIDEIAIVTSEACRGAVEELVERQRVTKVRRILEGGETRQDSSAAAIRAYEEEARAGPLNLLIHDAARPLVSSRIISNVLAALDHFGAVATAVPAPDTIVLLDTAANLVREIPERDTVRLNQTPQGFRYGIIKAAYDRAAEDPQFRATDDCGVVRRYLPDEKIAVVDGERTNLKLTYAEDLLLLEALLRQQSRT